MAAILLAAVVAYGPRLGHPLLEFDDTVLITRNAVVQELTPRTVVYAFTSYDPELYIPLTLLSYQIETAIFGVEPAVYHATNLLLHLLASLCIGLLILRLTKMPLAAVAGTALFALHPLNAEAVLWASARKDVLSSFLSLAGMLAFLRWRDSEQKKTYVAAVILFLLALLAKVHAVVVFPLLVLIDLYEGRMDRREMTKTYLPHAVLAAAFVIIAVVGKARVLGDAGMDTNLLLLIKSAAFYVWGFVWPFSFSILYPQAQPLSVMDIVPGAVVTLLLLAVAVSIRKRWPLITLGIAWYLIALVPSVASFTKNGFLFFASDRYAYLALGGVVLIAGWLLGLLAEQPRRLKPVAAAVVLLSAVLTWRTSVQAGIWRTEETLFQNAVDLYPSAALGWNNLAAQKMLAEDKTGAVAAFEKAIAEAPSYTVPYRNLAHLAFTAGDLAEAERRYAQAADVLRAKKVWTSDDVSTFASYSLLLENLGKTDDAFALLVEAAQRAPQFGEAHYNVGIKLQQQRKLPEAMIALQKAVDLSPNSADAWYHYAAVAAEIGRLPEALEALDTVLWLDPANENAVRHREAIRQMMQK